LEAAVRGYALVLRDFVMGVEAVASVVGDLVVLGVEIPVGERVGVVQFVGCGATCWDPAAVAICVPGVLKEVACPKSRLVTVLVPEMEGDGIVAVVALVVIALGLLGIGL
jgi:hypothetical protein